MTSRVVLDTNVLLSALLFEKGRLAWLRRSWQTGAIKPVLAEPTARELISVLAYPKFRLTRPAIDQLLGDVLPWCETRAGPIEPCRHQVLAAGVPVLVSGDGDLLALKNQLQPLLILTPAEFQIWLDTP